MNMSQEDMDKVSKCKNVTQGPRRGLRAFRNCYKVWGGVVAQGRVALSPLAGSKPQMHSCTSSAWTLLPDLSTQNFSSF